MRSHRAPAVTGIPEDSLHESDNGLIALAPDAGPATAESLAVWSERYQRLAIAGVQGKGKSQRTVFLSADARTALAEYLEQERTGDAREGEKEC